MGRDINFLFHFINSFVLILCFITSLRTIRRANYPGYMNYFFIFPLVSFLLLFFFYLAVLKIIRVELFHFIDKLSVIFYFSFFANFIYKVSAVNSKRVSFITIYSFFLVFIIWTLQSDRNSIPFISFSLSLVGLLILSIYYFHSLLNLDTNNVPLLREPSFWIITGIVFNSITAAPIGFFIYYLYNNSDGFIYNVFYSLMAISFLINYSTITKAYLCTAQAPLK
jgi:hypothetical protein